MKDERTMALQVGAVAVVELLGREHIAHTKTLDDLKITQNEESLHREIEEQRSAVEAKNAVIERLRSDVHEAKMAASSPVRDRNDKASKMLEALAAICDSTDMVPASLMGKGIADVIKVLAGIVDAPANG